MERLLAKSWDGDQPAPFSIMLNGHLADVYRSAVEILAGSAIDQLAAFGLDASWREQFEQVVSVAAAIHDLGKANAQFQAMLRGAREKQAIRHEWLTFWIAEQPAIKQWLHPALNHCEKLWHVMLCCVTGHHPKQSHTLPTRSCFQTSKRIEVYSCHDDFIECLNQITDWFDLQPAPLLPDLVVHEGVQDRQSGGIFMSLLEEQCLFFKREIQPSPEWRRFCACAKACLIGSDVAGSALWEQLENSEEQSRWIQLAMATRPSSDELDAIVGDRLNTNPPREFQLKIANSPASVTLVEAGCGTGKTVAAYMWSSKQHAGKRLWFCYPTTGTATEGFRGYLLDAELKNAKAGTDLFHSRANFDKLRLLDTNGDDQSDEDDLSIRVQSLQAWDTKIVACTVDTVLCLLQNQRRGLYSWPAIAQSAIVFDEVHCYDDVLFGNLLTFLRELPGIPVLIMTASLPKSKRVAIEKACTARSFETFDGPSDIESLPRYENANTAELPSTEIAIDVARDEYDVSGRVLWISNTVARTRSAAERLEDCNRVVYHSRFVYGDRIERHIDVTRMFDSLEAGIASTSQVAEMSLDLAHATLLVTELAPIPALIQRLGRLNRRASPDQLPCERPLRRFLVIEPIQDGEFSSAPYEVAELELAREWLTQLGTGPLSQKDLIDAWHAIETPCSLTPTDSGWLAGGIETPVNPIRKSGYGVTVIRACDIQKARTKECVVAYTLPMNNPSMKSWETGRFSGFPIAGDGTINYSSKLGAEWSSCHIF
ncbi:CRISPR-associated helicase Cas3' [Rosistilla oblonga]|uniref:CRISPR-associated helicase Cas3' n=1 Tax=Rosistilla oblonga TaxID=2527990 RepID=UPI003A971FBA